jgi:transcriptional regulator with XRE-family HTH domain
MTLAVELTGGSAGQPTQSFAGLLRQLRTAARLTQEELAEAASLSPRSISDLERGVNRTAHKNTAILLADALGVEDSVRTAFVAAARGRAPVSEVHAAMDSSPPEARPTGASAFPSDGSALTSNGIKFAQRIDAATSSAPVGGRPLERIRVVWLATIIDSEVTLAGPDGPETARLVISPRSRRQCRQSRARTRARGAGRPTC